MTLSPSPSLSPARAGDPGAASRQSALDARAEQVGFLVIDSCHSTWLFDPPAQRFRRILKGLEVDPALAATDWRPYVRLELSDDTDAFVVILNEAGTRRIRSWRHVDGCAQCDGEQTTELSVEDIRRLAQG